MILSGRRRDDFPGGGGGFLMISLYSSILLFLCRRRERCGVFFFSFSLPVGMEETGVILEAFFFYKGIGVFFFHLLLTCLLRRLRDERLYL